MKKKKLAMRSNPKAVLFGLSVVTALLPLHALQPRTMTLEQCIETALASSDLIKMGREKEAESRAAVKEAMTGFLPKISANATFTKLDEKPYIDASSMGKIMGSLYEPFFFFAQRDTAFARYLGEMIARSAVSEDDNRIYVGDDKLYSLIFTVKQPVFTGFKIINSYRAAQNGLKAAEQNNRKIRNDLVLAVKQGFFGVLLAERFIEVSDTSIKQLEAIVRDLENMRSQGMVGEEQIMKANVQLYNVQLMKVQAVNRAAMAKAALCNTMGIPMETDIEPVFDALRPEKDDLPQLPVLIDKAHASLPEIKAMEYQRDALKNIVNINRANYLPSVVALGNYNIKRPNRSYKPEFYNSWDVTVALQMNLFDWGEGWHKKTKSESQLRQLEISIDQAKKGIALGIEKSYLDVKEAFEKIAIAEKALEQARKSYAIIHDQLIFGMAKNTDLLEAQRSLTQANIEYHNGVINYHLKRSELEHVLMDNN